VYRDGTYYDGSTQISAILDKAVYENLLSVCDGVFCPHKIQDYISIEYYYKDFETLNFEEISKIVKDQEEKTETQKG